MVEEFQSRDPVPAVVTPVYRLSPNGAQPQCGEDPAGPRRPRCISLAPPVRDVLLTDWHRHTTYWGHVGMYGMIWNGSSSCA